MGDISFIVRARLSSCVPQYSAFIVLLLFRSESRCSDANKMLTCCLVSRFAVARACLQLITDCPQVIQDELDLISALSQLEDFSVRILPLQGTT